MMKLRGTFTKIFVGILFGLLILSFAVWGIGDMFRNPVHGGVVAQVGDQEITEMEFRRAFGRRYSQMQQSLGGGLSSELLRDLGIPEAVLGQLVTRRLLDQQAADLGLIVTDDQVRRMIFAQDIFRDSLGQFDRFSFEQFLRSQDMTEATFARELRRDAVQARISQALIGGTTAPEQVSRMLFAYQEQRRSAEYVRVPLPTADSVASPTEAELQTFYSDVADRFRSPEYRSVTALWIRPDDFLDEVVIDEDYLAEEYELRRDSLVEPEEREIEQIVLLTEEAAEAARAAMGEHSDLASLGEAIDAGAPINIGRFNRDTLSSTLGDALAEAAFSISTGEIGGPVQSDFGWHLVSAVDIQEGGDASFEAVRDDLAERLRREGAIETVISLANQLDDELAGGSGLEGAADLLAVPLLSFPALDAEGRDRNGLPAVGLPSGDSFLQLVAQSQPGEESFLMEDGQDGYFVLRVDSVTPPANRDLSEVRDQILAAYVEDQRRAAALERADSIAERVRQGAGLAEAAEEQDLALENSLPVTRFERDPLSVPANDFAPALFAADGDEPFIVEGEEGALVGVLASVETAQPDADAARFEDVQERLRRERAGEILALYLTDLQNRYGVSTNQTTLDYILTSF